MDALYTLKAQRDPDQPGVLTVRYPSKDLALAAAVVFRDQGATVTIVGPDGGFLIEASRDA